MLITRFVFRTNRSCFCRFKQQSSSKMLYISANYINCSDSWSEAKLNLSINLLVLRWVTEYTNQLEFECRLQQVQQSLWRRSWSFLATFTNSKKFILYFKILNRINAEPLFILTFKIFSLIDGAGQPNINLKG